MLVLQTFPCLGRGNIRSHWPDRGAASRNPWLYRAVEVRQQGVNLVIVHWIHLNKEDESCILSVTKGVIIYLFSGSSAFFHQLVSTLNTQNNPSLISHLPSSHLDGIFYVGTSLPARFFLHHHCSGVGRVGPGEGNNSSTLLIPKPMYKMKL